MIHKPTLQLISTLLLVAMLGGCALLPTTRTEQAADEAPTPTPIPTSPVPLKPTYQVKKGEVVKTLVFTGRISPVVEEELFFRAAGRVRTVFFKRNAMIKKGDLIADLEIDGLERSLKSAQLELERAQTVLREAEHNLEYDRKIAQVQLDMAQIRLDGLRSSPNPDNQAIALQEKEVQLSQYALERYNVGVSPLIKNDVTRAQYDVDKLNQEIQESQILAPFDGQLLSVSLTPGQAIDAYRPAATLADINKLEVSADLFSDQLKDLAEQQAATMELSGKPGQKLTGEIRKLPYPYGSGGSGQTVEEKDKSTRVTVNESPETGKYAMGDLVRVTVELERKQDVLWVPPQSIRNFNGRRFALLQDGDVQRRVDVTVGIQTDERVEIEEGLQEGQTIVGQ